MKFEGKAYRHTSQARDPRSQAGSIEYGGRWNAKDEFGALYLALSKATIKAEMKSAMKRFGLEESDYFPRKIAETRIMLYRVIDFRKAETRKKWGLTLADIQNPEQKKCQGVARRIREEGYEGIIYPSATRIGVNIAIFMDRLEEGTVVKVQQSRVAESLKEIA